jgi:glutamate/tyrosine decarboxylase-like PLP-dependent enzyme
MTTRDESPQARIAMTPAEFRSVGHGLVEAIAAFYESLPSRPITRGETPDAIRALLGEGALPVAGMPAADLASAVAPLLFEHSLHNGHPRFFGYITSSAAPFGALADLLAAAVNANVGLWNLAPAASEIEAQTVRWLAELVGYPADCGGLMVSGGNMANVLAFIAARRARTPWDVRAAGVAGDARRLAVYATRETHTWIQKAADVTGLGTEAVRYVVTDAAQRMDVAALRDAVAADRAAGIVPLAVVATAGNVSTGAVDPLPEIAAAARELSLWFHVDGAYGAPAAALPEADADLRGLALADSVALDPHKWLYSPIEAACVLVRERRSLLDAFSYRPPYYRIEDDDGGRRNDYYEQGLQNTRGFRALKVWLLLKYLGRDGYRELFRGNIALAARLFAAAQAQAEIEACMHNLSIVTFRFVPEGLAAETPAVNAYLDELNEALVAELQAGGEVYVSNAVVEGRYLLRACIVNFRTTASDVDAVLPIVVQVGRVLDAALRPQTLGSTRV